MLARGVSLHLIGNGNAEMAADFVRSFRVRIPVYTDPGRRTYTAVGFKHGLLTTLDTRTLKRGAEVLRAGYAQGRTMGDAFQQGGAIVVTADGQVPFVYVNAYAGAEITPEALWAEVQKLG